MTRREISLSEIIQITFITENEKKEQQKINVTHDLGVTLMTTLLQKKLISGSFCGGRGTCGRCRVRFLQAAPFPTSLDRQAFTPDELRLGYRLACMSRPGRDCVVKAEFAESRELDIVTDIRDVMNVSGKNDCSGQEKKTEKRFLAAVDLGTTTIAMQLMEADSGGTADTYCAMNPQSSYGADVLSRIQAANGRTTGGGAAREHTADTETVNERTTGAGAADIMRESVWKVIRDGLDRFYGKIAERKEGVLCCMCIAGNTTMEHLLLGLSTQGLGRSPFTPAELGLQKRYLPDVRGGRLPVYITPGISAFVGGDIVAGLYWLKMLPLCGAGSNGKPPSDGGTLRDEERRDAGIVNQSGQCDGNAGRKAALLIDLGTNGEMAIADGKRMVVTAAAAGPAFEGGPGKAVAGSDMVAMTAFLRKEGVIDETGLLADPYFDEGVTVFVSGSRFSLSPFVKSGVGESAVSEGLTDSANTQMAICLTQKDIRDLQMAKAAVRAGVEILHQKMGRPFVERVYLAGGFGYYLDVNAAVAIGLLPGEWKPYTKAVGNTSLAGAFQMGKDLWTGKLKEETLSEMMQGIESVNLAKEPEFGELYIRYMELEHS